MKIKYIRTLFFIFILCSYGFLSAQEKAVKPSKKLYPVTIIVSSQSSFVDPVNISVEIDSENKIIDKDFFLGDGHNFSKYEINLDESSHRFMVESKNGNAGSDLVLNVDKPLWLYIDYWGPNHFQISISEEALRLM